MLPKTVSDQETAHEYRAKDSDHAEDFAFQVLPQALGGLALSHLSLRTTVAHLFCFLGRHVVGTFVSATQLILNRKPKAYKNGTKHSAAAGYDPVKKVYRAD
jgi:hypothetical protein